MSTDPANRVLVLEAGPPRLPFDVFVHMPAALDVPDRKPVLRLEVRVGTGTVHERPSGLPRPGQGHGRLEHHQRDDLPAGRPARLRALGGGPEHGETGLRPLPTVLQAAEVVPGRGSRRPLSAATRARSASRARPRQEPAFRRLLRGRPGGGPVGPDGEDVNGYRREGFAVVRSEHPPGSPLEVDGRTLHQ